MQDHRLCSNQPSSHLATQRSNIICPRVPRYVLSLRLVSLGSHPRMESLDSHKNHLSSNNSISRYSSSSRHSSSHCSNNRCSSRRCNSIKRSQHHHRELVT